MPSPKHMLLVSFNVVIRWSPAFCLQNHGRSALHGAAINGRLAIAKRLLERGADPTLRDRDGDTALDDARVRGNSEVVALLSEPRYADGDRTECELNADLNANRMRNRLRNE